MCVIKLQIFFAIGIPVDIPDRSVTFSFYFEANYVLPTDDKINYFGNYSLDKSIDRRMAYGIFTRQMERYTTYTFGNSLSLSLIVYNHYRRSFIYRIRLYTCSVYIQIIHFNTPTTTTTTTVVTRQWLFVLCSYGLPGADCLLRTICEVNASTLSGNGLIGDLVRIFFT